MPVRRADKHLNEVLSVLDAHYEIHSDGDPRASPRTAFQSLGRAEKQFVENEIIRCKQDVRYYLENYHVIKTEQEGFRTIWPLWDSQEIIFTEFMHNWMEQRQCKKLILKARQVGSSTFSQAILFHRTIFTEACNSLLVAQDPGAASEIFEMSRLAWENLPWWMRPEKRYDAKGKYMQFDRNDPIQRMKNPGLKSQILVEAANKMSGVAVGKTFRNAHLSEIARWPNGDIMARELEPAMNAADMFAVMESTALGKSGFWYRMWVDCVEGRLDWEPIFVEWYRRKEYSIPMAKGETFVRTKEEIGLCERALEDSGFTITDESLKWRRIKIANYEAQTGDEWAFYESYPMNWREAFQATGLCAFDKKKLQVLFNTTAHRPVWTGEIKYDIKTRRPKLEPWKRLPPEAKIPIQAQYGNRLFVWEAPSPKKKYYIGADVAEGVIGGNFSCASVYEIGQHKDTQVAEWHGWINAEPFAQVLAALGYLFKGVDEAAEIACESNNVGKTVNNTLVRSIEYPCVYRWKHLDKLKNFMTDFFGFETNVKTRPIIIDKMRQAIDQDVIILRSEATIDQMMSFAQPEDGGRWEGQDALDDRVFANMIAFHCIHEMDWGKPRDFEGKEEKKDEYADFFNTSYSPIYDKLGIRQDMVLKGNIPPEMVKLYVDIDNPEMPVDDDDKWRCW
jgi:hypothetical protein